MNIVVVQAFPANETLSSRIIRFLNDYFQVYFVNLPGFHPTVPPTSDACLKSFVQHVESRIDDLGLDETILAGVEPDRLKVIHTRVDHYPEEPSYEYFKRTFAEDEFESIFNFIGSTSGDTVA